MLGAHQAGAMVDMRLASRQLFVWDDRGPVSMLVISPTIAGVTRIGPVYTPSKLR